MRSSVPGVLSVHEGGDILPVAVAVSENDLDIGTFQMNRRIDGVLCKSLVHKVEETVLGLVFHTVENQ